MLEDTLSQSLPDLLAALSGEVEHILDDGPSINLTPRLEEVVHRHRRDAPDIGYLQQSWVVANQDGAATSALRVLTGGAHVVLGVVSEDDDSDPSLVLAATGDPVECVVHGIDSADASESQVDDVAVSEAVLAVGRGVSLLEHIHDVGGCGL